MTTPRGVRSIGEKQLQKNRALIFTNENKDELLAIWNQIPDGTLHVDPETGVISQKLAGETSWVPYGVRQDNTLVISRDTQFNEESFVIISIDAKSNAFVYENSQGMKTHSTCLNNGSEFVFILEKGSYMMGRNHLEVTLDDCLIRSVMSGGVEEVSDLKFKVLDELSVGQKVTVRYVKWTRIGNPYPRIYMNGEEPEEAEIGDLWVNTEGTVGEDADDFDTPDNKILWQDITGLPTTLAGFGITDRISLEGHVHRVADITDFPSAMPANGGNSNTVANRKPGTAPGNLVYLNEGGKIDNSLVDSNILVNMGMLYVQDARPTGAAENAIWFCTESDDLHIEVYKNRNWIRMNKKVELNDYQ